MRITPERFAQVEDYFGRYGGRTILIGRFIGLVRALAPFIAGSSGMTYRGFAPYSILGTGLWAATFSILGYVLAENIEKAEDLASRGIFIFGGTIAILVGGYLAIRYMRVAGEPLEAGAAVGGDAARSVGGGARAAHRAAGAVLLEPADAGEPGARVHDDHGLRRGLAVHRDRLRHRRVW